VSDDGASGPPSIVQQGPGRQAGNLRLSREIKRLGRYGGLIIDDLGYLQQSRDDMEVVFTLLAERYERGSVLMTSNLPRTTSSTPDDPERQEMERVRQLPAMATPSYVPCRLLTGAEQAS
jgi:IstB-like ATP binding protein